MQLVINSVESLNSPVYSAPPCSLLNCVGYGQHILSIIIYLTPMCTLGSEYKKNRYNHNNK